MSEYTWDNNTNKMSGSVMQTSFDEQSFNNVKLMMYEKSNAFALAYYSMSGNAQKLLIAALTCVHNINHEKPLTEKEKRDGFWIAVPIKHVAMLMGCDLKKNKNFYRTVKESAENLVELHVTMESKDGNSQSFDVFTVIPRIMYNPNGDGNVYFNFAGGTSQYYLDNSGDFTKYSLMLSQKVGEKGDLAAVRLAEVLKTSLYKANLSKTGLVSVYYDYVDLRAMLSLVDVDDPAVKNIMKSNKYSDYIHNGRVAYERVKAIKELDGWLNESESLRSKKSHRVARFSTYGNFRKLVLLPAQKVFAQCIKEFPDLMDMMFEFEPRKYNGEVIGIYFTVYTVEGYMAKEASNGVQLSLFDILEENNDVSKTVERGMYEDISAVRITEAPEEKTKKRETEDNLQKLANFYDSLDCPKYPLTMTDLITLSQTAAAEIVIEKYKMMSKKNGIKNPVKWLVAAIRDNYQDEDSSVYSSSSRKTKYKNHNFEQREYDFEDLEKKLISN